MPSFRPTHRRERDAAVERDEPPIMLHRQREKINIGDLAGSKDAGAIENLRISDGDTVRPEFMRVKVDLRYESPHGGGQRHRILISGLRDDTQEAVLRQRTAGPSLIRMARQPCPCEPMMNMLAVQTCKKNVHIEQSPHGYSRRLMRASSSSASSISRSTSSLVTIPPLGGKEYQPSSKTIPSGSSKD